MNSKPINLLKSEYKLLGKIGSGGFSFVYLVENITKSGDLCAAKFQVLQNKYFRGALVMSNYFFQIKFSVSDVLQSPKLLIYRM